MCHMFYHICRLCKKHYECNENNYVCPTINKDANMNLCKECEVKYWKYMQEKENEK